MAKKAYIIASIEKRFKDSNIHLLELTKTQDIMDHTVRTWYLEFTSGEKWWVLEGDNMPINFYVQEPIKLSDDEALSMHLGILLRMGFFDRK